ncbi:MAG: hypothetical protein LBS72_05935 [Oscillospiraceae bacterium]|nr:hypothetical protein [Oscillospiraceae bacterium]
MKNQKYKMICINDTPTVTNFEEQKRTIQNCFDSILPDRSSFERESITVGAAREREVTSAAI